MVAGVHFPPATPAFDIGYKILAVNLSDLAAMGATPLGTKLSLVAPDPETSWLDELEAGCRELARVYSISPELETPAAGALVVTAQVYGGVPGPQAITRRDARVDDVMLVTGTLGDAGAGLDSVLGHITLSEPGRETLEARLNRPTPRVREGLLLRGQASAGIDVSDGLLADLGHLARSSHLGARVDVSCLPLSASLRECVPIDEARRYALSSGDDYELLFTCAPDDVDDLCRDIKALGTPCTAIGTMVSTPGIELIGGSVAPAETDGWEHFR